MVAQWPPQSSCEALLSTPAGRESLRQRLADPKAPRPSPAKRSRPAARKVNHAIPSEIDEDEDEETLQLKLQAIEARLKLKELRAKTQREGGEAVTAWSQSRTDGEANRRRESGSAPIGAEGRKQCGGAAIGVPLQSRLAVARHREDGRPKSAVEVPASPVKKVGAHSTASPTTMKALGIDKGWRAADVSLKRAPISSCASRTCPPAPREGEAPSRPLSFNERLVNARSAESAKKERQRRLQGIRNKAFGIAKDEMDRYKKSAVDIPDVPDRAHEFTREEILAAQGGARSPSRAAVVLQRCRRPEDDAPECNIPIHGSPENSPQPTTASSIEPYSGFHLKTRFLPHNVLACAMSGKKTYGIKDLLRAVKAPDWDLPNVEADVVVLAIVATKSEPRSHRPGPESAKDRGKYMVLTLVDLQWEIELFLFNSGFERFWKLTEGTVVAVLNPTVMEPPPGRKDTGRFSLVINSDADTILEVGSARDLGYCKSVKRDGSLCRGWVNAKRTEYCEFHTNEALRRTRQARIELNDGGKGPVESTGLRQRRRPGTEKKEHEKMLRGTYDRGSGTHVFVARASAAQADEDGGMRDRAEREEALKRRLAAREKEREMAKRLGEVGGGAGREYMSLTGTASSASHGGVLETPPGLNVRARSLLAPRGKQPPIDLSSVKRRCTSAGSSAGASASAPTIIAHRHGNQSLTEKRQSGSVKPALGWGAFLQDKLSRIKEGQGLAESSFPPSNSFETRALRIAASKEKRRGEEECSSPPARKKTRFVVPEKGIREAGRDNVGERLFFYRMPAERRAIVTRGASGDVHDDDDDDDDDLVIVDESRHAGKETP